MEIYRRAIRIDESIGKLILTLDLEPSPESSVTIAKRADNVRDSILAFDDYYQPRRLIFSANISGVLDQLSELYATVPRTFYDNIDPDVWETEVYNGVAAVVKNVPDTADLIRTLESEFRSLYGSLDSPNAAAI